MLGDIVELSVVVRDLDAAAARFSRLFGLRVHRRDTRDQHERSEPGDETAFR